MVHKAAESLLEIGVFTGRRVDAGLRCLFHDMARDIIAQVQDTLAAIVSLLLVFHAT